MSNKGSVLLQTSLGAITLELYWSHAPKTCENFYQLAKKGYYDGQVSVEDARWQSRTSGTSP